MFENYWLTVMVMGGLGVLLLVQLLIADVVGLTRKKVPGFPVSADHEDFLFRAIRAHSNTNESVAIFILFALFGMHVGANAWYLNLFATVYFIGRLAHMACYYMNLKLVRSISFVVAIVGLLGMLLVGAIAVI